MRSVIYPGSFYKTDELVVKLESYGIEKALVYHSMAREYDAVAGNAMLMKEISSYRQLLPAWIVMPHYTGEFPSPEYLLKEMKNNNVQVVRMFPQAAEQNYSISPWNCGELFSCLEKHRIPLFIGMDQISWNELYEIANTYPNMKIILTDLTYRMDRNLYVLLKKFPCIYLETSGYKVNNCIEEICNKFGAERLVFGSGMPVFTGAAVCAVKYARITVKEKMMIACENMEAMLKDVNL